MFRGSRSCRRDRQFRDARDVDNHSHIRAADGVLHRRALVAHAPGGAQSARAEEVDRRLHHRRARARADGEESRDRVAPVVLHQFDELAPARPAAETGRLDGIVGLRPAVCGDDAVRSPCPTRPSGSLRRKDARIGAGEANRAGGREVCGAALQRREPPTPREDVEPPAAHGGGTGDPMCMRIASRTGCAEISAIALTSRAPPFSRRFGLTRKPSTYCLGGA